MNKNHIFILALVILSPISILSSNYLSEIIFHSGEIYENEILEEINELDSEPTEQSIDFFTYISSVDFIKGTDDDISNSLDDLKNVNDQEKYEIKPEWSDALNVYQYDIHFEFEQIDLGVTSQHYYDLFLYLDIDTPTISDPIYFQKYTYDKNTDTFSWITVYEISDNKTSVQKIYLENAFKFRIFGDINQEKLISIDRLKVIMTHSGRYVSGYGREINIASLIFMQGHIQSGSFADTYKSGDNQFLILQPSSTSLGDYGYIYSLAAGIYFNYPLNPQGDYYCYIDYSTTSSGILQYNEGHQIVQGSNVHLDGLHLTGLSSMSITAFAFGTSSFVWSIDRFVLIEGINKDQYPIIDQLGLNISSPISTLEDFLLQTSISNIDGSNSDVQYNIQNSTWNSGWIDMEQDNPQTFEATIKNYKLENGEYTAWINATNNDYSTLDYIDFEVDNSRPRIEFINPQPNEIIKKAYDYNISVLISDFENDTITEVPEIGLFNSDNELIFGWLEMDLTKIDKGAERDIYHYNFTINPINSKYGEYIIKVRARDKRGYGYDEVIILANVIEPVIKFISPSEEIVNVTSKYVDYLVNISAIDPLVRGYIKSNATLRVMNFTSQEIEMDWVNMTPDDVNNQLFYTYKIDPIDFGEGLHILNVKVNNSIDIYSKNVTFRFQKETPNITFTSPKSDLEKVSKFYDFRINVTVDNPDADPYNNVKIMLFNFTGDQMWIDWKDMTRIGVSDNWSLEINPLDYDVGIYKLEAYVENYIEKGVGEIWFDIDVQEVAVSFKVDPSNPLIISDSEQIYSIKFNVTKGDDSIERFQWFISETIQNNGRGDIPIHTIQSGSINHIQGTVEYEIFLNPKDLPNGFSYFSFIIQNKLGDLAYYPSRLLNVNYFINKSSSYIIDDTITYDIDTVRVNSITEGRVSVTYSGEKYYNYIISVPKILENQINTLNPNYRIIDTINNKTYKSLMNQGFLYFEFMDKAPSEHTLTFNIDTPTLTKFGKIKEKTLEDDKISIDLELKLNSKFYYTNVLCEYVLNDLDYSEDYDYKLYISRDGIWIDSGIDLNFKTNKDKAIWTFLVPKILSSEEITFRIYGIRDAPEEQLEFNYTPYLYGAIFSGIFGVVWMVLIRKKLLRTEFFEKRSKLFWIIGIGVTVAIFVGIFFTISAIASFSPYTI